ncbi:MAG: DUF3179 domain-containing (seleno)protein [Anaerolineae bacterium]
MLTDTRSFDLAHAHLEDYLDTNIFPARLEVTDSQVLQDALAAGKLAPETRLLTFEVENVLYAFPMTVVLSYNVIQGHISPEKPWLMTFCNACNTGMVFDPVVDGKPLHFRRRGAYEGLLLIWDEETATYWQHITGEALYGSSQGKRIRQITNTRQMTAAEAAARPVRSLLLDSPLTPAQQQLVRITERMRANPETMPGISETIGEEDTRRPRFELGLGVWSGTGSMFFPLVALHTVDNVLRSTFGGHPLIVYQSPEAVSPSAVYLNSRTAYWEGSTLRLDNGAFIRDDEYYTSDGVAQPLARPNQLLMRWYGFAQTFPNPALPAAS